MARFGPELVVNGNFTAWTNDDPDSWIVDSELGGGDPGTRDPEVSQVATGQTHASAGGETGGMANLYSGNNALIVSQTVTLEVGKTYKLSINFDTITTSGVFVHNVGWNQWPAFSTDDTGTGVHSVIFECTRASTSLLIEDLAVGGIDVTVDDVSIKEVITWSDANPIVLFNFTGDITISTGSIKVKTIAFHSATAGDVFALEDKNGVKVVTMGQKYAAGTTIVNYKGGGMQFDKGLYFDADDTNSGLGAGDYVLIYQ